MVHQKIADIEVVSSLIKLIKKRTDKDGESGKEKTMAVTLKPYKASGGLRKAKAQAECVRPAAKMDKTWR